MNSEEIVKEILNRFEGKIVCLTMTCLERDEAESKLRTQDIKIQIMSKTIQRAVVKAKSIKETAVNEKTLKELINILEDRIGVNV